MGAARRVAMMSAVAMVSAGTTLLGGCGFGPPQDTSGQPPNLPAPPSPSFSVSPRSSGVDVQVLAKNLSVPWGLAFLPDGSALVTERDTFRILAVSAGGKVTVAQTLTGVVHGGGEGGLLGIAVSPSYAKDKTAFVYYSTARDNRIARLVLGHPPVPIVTGIPAAPIHNGGRLAFGPDGFLYASTGDGGVGSRAQDLTNLGGKILRMTTAGRPAPGNPFAGSLVWSYGHRNVQGLAWDSQKRLYATEFGLHKADELNLIRRGGNYGWPAVEGVGGLKGRYVAPLTTWPVADASPSGIAIVGNTAIIACLRGKRLLAVDLDPASGRATGEPQIALRDTYGRLRTVVAAPDGSLWATTSNRDGRGTPAVDDDRILRIVPPGGGGVSVL